MQIVIDIPKGFYYSVQDGHIGSCTRFATEAILNGVILPEEHGRLIDIDVAKDKIGNLDGFGFIGKCLDEIPSILESNKEYNNADSN